MSANIGCQGSFAPCFLCRPRYKQAAPHHASSPALSSRYASGQQACRGMSQGPFHRSAVLPRQRVLQLRQASAAGGINPSEPNRPRAGSQQEEQHAEEDEDEYDDHAGYAVLHDFCMMIPYGVLALIVGMMLFFTPAPLKLLWLPLVGAGGIAIMTSILSLRQWKQGQRTTPLTLSTAACSAGAAYLGWQHTHTALALGLGGPVVPWIAAAMTALSGVLALFCVYNVLAGGNPLARGINRLG